MEPAMTDPQTIPFEPESEPESESEVEAASAVEAASETGAASEVEAASEAELGRVVARLQEFGPAETWQEAGESARARWDAPYGPAERWELRIEDTRAPGPHGPVPVRIYTPAAAAEGPRPVLVWCHGGAFMHGDLDMPEADQVARGVAGRAGAVDRKSTRLNS